MKHFKEHEFACKCGCGLGYKDMDLRLLVVLDEVREEVDMPFSITSAARCKEHNSNVGGSSYSEHVPENTHNGKATAVDIRVRDSNFLFKTVKALLARGVKRIGWSQKNNFIHVGISESDKHPQEVFFKY